MTYLKKRLYWDGWRNPYWINKYKQVEINNKLYKFNNKIEFITDPIAQLRLHGWYGVSFK